jgi:methylenetetrahydrofolate dehydrogenase (NADP+)/methenyltetrahydrofolate cyclohydrolase
VVVVGRSDIVGKPMAIMLMQRGGGGDATVTVCHSR